MRRPQCDRRERLHRVMFIDSEAKFLSDCRYNQRRLHQCEGISNALARAAAKRKVSKARNPLLQVALPAFWQKLLRIAEPARIAMHHPLRARDAISRL